MKTVKTTNYNWKEMDRKEAEKILSEMPLRERLESLQDAPETITFYKVWIRESKAELIQWYMNAQCTRSCGGHFTGQMNDNFVKEYTLLMEKYDVPIPSKKVCYVLGEFNGDGSF